MAVWIQILCIAVMTLLECCVWSELFKIRIGKFRDKNGARLERTASAIAPLIFRGFFTAF